MSVPTPRFRLVFLLLVPGCAGILWGTGWLLWGALFATLALAVLGVRELLPPRRRGRLANLSLSAAALGTTFILVEVALGALETTGLSAAPVPPAPTSSTENPAFELAASLLSHTEREAIANRQSLLTMPPEWSHQRVEVPGATRAYRWHGALHVHDENRLRRAEPIPPRRPGVTRVVVLGDSLTYGYGVEEKRTYPSLLEALLGDPEPVEVLNLGTTGLQSQDILAQLVRLGPGLQPDLVVYGVCLNDFLTSGISQYDGRDRYPLPLPEGLKKHFADRTRLGRLFEDLYDRALRRLNLRFDFFDDILRDFDNYRTRFEHDVTRLNQVAAQLTGRPLTALVLDQSPGGDPRSREIARVAEELLRKGGADVVSTDAYYETFDGHSMHVSRWEGHPNEEAHAIWAALLATHLRQSFE